MDGTLTSMIFVVGTGYALEWWDHQWKGNLHNETLQLGLNGQDVLQALGVQPEQGSQTRILRSGITLTTSALTSSAPYGVITSLISHGRYQVHQNWVLKFLTEDLLVASKVLFILSVWGLLAGLILTRTDLTVYSNTAINLSLIFGMVSVYLDSHFAQQSLKKLEKEHQVPAEDLKTLRFFLTLNFLQEVSKFLTSPLKLRLR